jgi:hypothetical protein
MLRSLGIAAVVALLLTAPTARLTTGSAHSQATTTLTICVPQGAGHSTSGALPAQPFAQSAKRGRSALSHGGGTPANARELG